MASAQGINSNMPQGFAMSNNTTPINNMATLNPQQLSPTTQEFILNGSVSLKSQMLSMSAQNNHQSAAAMLPLQLGHQQQPSRPRPQLDPKILSRMVTASGKGFSNGCMPIRMASMQEFRRSMNSLNTVPESSRQPRARAPNQAFGLNNRRASLGPRLPSDNPLLKMMEQRMAAANNVAAAEKESQPPPVMSNDNKVALQLQASISKWSGMGPGAVASVNQSEGSKTRVHDSARPVLKPPVADPPQTSGRVPLSFSQVSLLQELTASQHVKDDVPMLSKAELFKQLLLTQGQGGLAQNDTANVQQAGHYGMSNVQPAPSPYLPIPSRNAHPGLARCGSSAEVDRLRRENRSIQLQQGLAMQERAMQERMREQAYLHQRSIAVSALVSMQQNDGGQAAVTQELLNQLHRDQSSSTLNSLSGELNPKLAPSLRKRRSLRPEEDDESCCGSLTSHTQSIGSSTGSSYKIHRSTSYGSARAALSGSMENLHITAAQQLLNESLRNQSFSSGNNNVSDRAVFGGLDVMANQSFSSDSRSSSSQRRKVTSSQRHKVTLRRNSSSSNWIKSMLSEQNSAGKAAATFEVALQNSISSQSLITPQHVQPGHLTKEREEVLSPKPIQVHAEEYCPPLVERPPSTSSETVIISELPDRIKYQNVKAGTNPLDVVKEALSSRCFKCDTKPSIDMDESFFVHVPEMYGQEVVNAIRSNDVEGLRKLSGDGVNLQCGNKFGETLIHLACRRSSLDLVSFLVNGAGVSLRVRDDFGRTPMHDACWRAQPDLELLDMLLDQAPELLMLSDKRGHTPLDYARREHWPVLIPFLLERADKFRSVC